MCETTFGQRVRLARDRQDYTLEKVGELLTVEAREACSAQRVSNWERTNKTPDLDMVRHIATVLRVSPLWLAWGIGSIENESGTSGLGFVAERGRAVPLLDSAALVIERVQSTVNSQQVHTYYDCGPGAYALRIEDRSNDPAFTVNDTVVIDPDERPIPGDMVLAVLKPDDRIVFRRYALRTNTDGSKYAELQPLNPSWEVDVVRSSDDGRIVGVMTEYAKPRR